MSEKKPSAPAKEFPGQHDDETVEFVFRQHPLVMRKQLIFGLFGLVVAALPFDFPQVYDSTALTHWTGDCGTRDSDSGAIHVVSSLGRVVLQRVYRK